MGRIDSSFGTNTLQPGDSVTALVTFVQKANRTQWLLYVEAITPNLKKKPKKSWITISSSFGKPIKFESEPAPAKLRLLGPFAISDVSRTEKAREKDARIWLDKDFLGLGLDQAAALELRLDRMTNSKSSEPTTKATLAKTMISRKSRSTLKPTPAELRVIYGQFPALYSYVHLVLQTKGLKALFFKLVELPSVWSMIRHLGMDWGISADGPPTRANPADWDLPAAADVYNYPWQLNLNGKLVLKVTLVVTSPHPPLLICSGVVGVLAQKAGDSKTYMTLRIVNAHEVKRN